jgi:hypothetical protein
MSAVDWATVVTGVVGVAGIGGTLLSARMTSKSDAANLRTSIAAEDMRAKVTEKRRVYAKYIASMIEVIVATVAFDSYGKKTDVKAFGPYGKKTDDKERRALLARIDESVAAMGSAVSEVWLVAPQALSQQADDMARSVGKYALDLQRSVESDIGFFKMRDSLYRAMRADLGELVSDAKAELPNTPPDAAHAGHSDHGHVG